MLRTYGDGFDDVGIGFRDNEFDPDHRFPFQVVFGGPRRPRLRTTPIGAPCSSPTTWSICRTKSISPEWAARSQDRIYAIYGACAETSERSFVRGEVDGDGRVTLSDAVTVLDYLFRGGGSGGAVPGGGWSEGGLFRGGAGARCLDAMDADDRRRRALSDRRAGDGRSRARPRWDPRRSRGTDSAGAVRRGTGSRAAAPRR